MDNNTERYVAQLEKRLLEQEQLISLLNEKIASLESATDGGKSFAGALKFGPNVVSSGSSGGAKSNNRDSAPSFVGSRKTTLSSVPTVRYCQFFATRMNPTTTAVELAKDLLKDVENLTSVKCCKLKTKHPSYSSFHVVVPEEQKQLVCGEEAWPEGAFVKLFSGRLLDSYILESYDSQSDEFRNFTKPAGSAKQDKPSHQTKKAPEKPNAKAATQKSNVSEIDNTRRPSGTKSAKPRLPSSSSSPAATTSPKNSERQTRANSKVIK